MSVFSNVIRTSYLRAFLYFRQLSWRSILRARSDKFITCWLQTNHQQLGGHHLDRTEHLLQFGQKFPHVDIDGFKYALVHMQHLLLSTNTGMQYSRFNLYSCLYIVLQTPRVPRWEITCVNWQTTMYSAAGNADSELFCHKDMNFRSFSRNGTCILRMKCSVLISVICFWYLNAHVWLDL